MFADFMGECYDQMVNNAAKMHYIFDGHFRAPIVVRTAAGGGFGGGPHHIEGGTFTVSNLGMYGVDGGAPLPWVPESAILLVGAARTRPVAHECQIAILDVAWFSLSFDHRFIDGAVAARFLQDLQTVLLAPGPLLA